MSKESRPAEGGSGRPDWRRIWARVRHPRTNERAALYSLPLMLQWIIAVTWETDASALRAGRRAMVLSLAFLAGIVAIYLVEALATSLLPFSAYYVAWLSLVLHSLVALAYVGGSVLVVAREWLERPLEVPVLDELADRLEATVSV